MLHLYVRLDHVQVAAPHGPFSKDDNIVEVQRFLSMILWPSS